MFQNLIEQKSLKLKKNLIFTFLCRFLSSYLIFLWFVLWLLNCGLILINIKQKWSRQKSVFIKFSFELIGLNHIEIIRLGSEFFFISFDNWDFVSLVVIWKINSIEFRIFFYLMESSWELNIYRQPSSE